MTQSLKRRPTHPGAMLREEFIVAGKLDLAEVAKALGLSRRKVMNLLSTRSTVTPDLALRLSAVFNTSPEFWLNLQARYDLWKARHKIDVTKLRRLI